jgi:glycosyltransferase involved in cell wall biosynthesis
VSQAKVKELALFHPAGHFKQRGNPFGKDIANAALFRALACHGGYGRVTVMHQLGLTPPQLAQGLFPDGKPRAEVAGAPLFSTEAPARGGVLLRGQPYLAELAWARRAAGREEAYSLVGLIHTIAPPAIREQIGASATAPVQAWDALICSSPAVREAMEVMFDGWAAHLQERLGAVRAPRPQLPIIPLAVEVERIAAEADAAEGRRELRQRHGIASADLVVLWVGRLSFFEKAFPQPMFQAVELAAQAAGVRVHFLMAGWFPRGEKDRDLYLQAARAHAPSVPLVLLDGNDPAVLARCWAAADVFLSLVDNIQETFGLTPVEAMAAGLPVVVSDWDGYRFTVQDGEQGFLVPTLGAPPGVPGEMLCHRHAMLAESYQAYVGAVAQHTAVHIGRAAEALRRLFLDSSLRARFGAAGRHRARTMFSWPVVVAQYNELFAELAERREKAPTGEASAACCRLSPLRGDPFADLEGFASALLQDDIRLRLRAGLAANALGRLREVELDRLFPASRGTEEEALLVLRLLEKKGVCSVQKLVARFPAERRDFIRMTLMWLAKLGLVDWLED